MIQINAPYPISNNRYYRKFQNQMCLSKAGKVFKQIVFLENLKAVNPTNDPYFLDIMIHPKLTKGNRASEVLLDLDNALKCILDSLISIVYIDDKQVKQIHVKYGDPIYKGGATIKAHIFTLAEESAVDI